ncbi:MAG: macA 6 [Planctomycetota bacterium]|nr:macA 6 [Planctomycetota bacterium]
MSPSSDRDAEIPVHVSLKKGWSLMNLPSIIGRLGDELRGLVPGLLLVGLAFSPALGRPQGEGERAAIEALAGEILGRMDAAETLRLQHEQAAIAVERAKAALGKAELASNFANIAIEEYRRGTIPQDLQTVTGEIKLAESEVARAKDRVAWSEKMTKRGSISESQLVEDRMSAQKSEIVLVNANTKLKVLQQYTFEKQITHLQAAQKAALAEVLSKKNEFERSRDDLAKADRARASMELSAVESQVLLRLDAAVRLFDDGKAEPARVKLGEAQTLWRNEQALRAQARFHEMKQKVRSAAAKVKPAGT